MIGTCLCRRVKVEVVGQPGHINICNCAYCRKAGHAAGLFPESAVEVCGETRSYVRDDMADPWMTLHFCPTCRSATHSTGTPEHPCDVVRVNVRLFDLGAVADVEARFLDGDAVKSEDDPFPLIATANYGRGTTF